MRRRLLAQQLLSNVPPHVQKGKYTLIEIDHGSDDDTEEVEKALAKIEGPVRVTKHLPCSLPEATQSLMSLIFSQDMFKQTLVSFNIDVKKMPLGKLRYDLPRFIA